MKKTYLIDLDGTMYRGTLLIEGAMHFVHELIKRKEEFYFLTNNAKRTKRQNVEHMERMGYCGIKEEHFSLVLWLQLSMPVSIMKAEKHIISDRMVYEKLWRMKGLPLMIQTLILFLSA